MLSVIPLSLAIRFSGVPLFPACSAFCCSFAFLSSHFPVSYLFIVRICHPIISQFIVMTHGKLPSSNWYLFLQSIHHSPYNDLTNHHFCSKEKAWLSLPDLVYVEMVQYATVEYCGYLCIHKCCSICIVY